MWSIYIWAYIASAFAGSSAGKKTVAIEFYTKTLRYLFITLNLITIRIELRLTFCIRCLLVTVFLTLRMKPSGVLVFVVVIFGLGLGACSLSLARTECQTVTSFKPTIRFSTLDLIAIRIELRLAFYIPLYFQPYINA